MPSLPKTRRIAEDNGFSRRISWLGERDFVIRKGKIFDLRGKLHKELTATQVEEIDTTKHRFRATWIKRVNKQDGRSSIIRVDEIKLRSATPDKYFTAPYLERI